MLLGIVGIVRIFTKKEDNKMNKKDLILFEKEIANLFNKGKIKSPVHLYNGNEDKIIDVFKNIRPHHFFLVLFEIIRGRVT